MDYSVLTVRREGDGNQIWIKGPTATLEFYGWTKIYEPWQVKLHDDGHGNKFAYYGRKPVTGRSGGQRLRICRSIRRGGHPARLTNCFRIHSHITNRDLAEMAHFAGPQVGWMESKCGRRLYWDEWEAYYQGQTLPFHQGPRRRLA